MSDGFRERVIVTGIPREEVEVALGYLGSRGYHIEVEQIEDQYEPLLGFAGKEDLSEYAKQVYKNSIANAKAMPTRVINSLHRLDKKINLRLPDGRQLFYQDKIDVDVLAWIHDANLFSLSTDFGEAKTRFVEGFIESRRATLVQASGGNK